MMDYTVVKYGSTESTKISVRILHLIPINNALNWIMFILVLKHQNIIKEIKLVSIVLKFEIIFTFKIYKCAQFYVE